MTCFNTIEELKANWIAKTGSEPTDIYVGKNEMRTLLLEAQEYGVVLTEDMGCASPSVCGLALHQTDDETHLGLGVHAAEI